MKIATFLLLQPNFVKISYGFLRFYVVVVNILHTEVNANAQEISNFPEHKFRVNIRFDMLLSWSVAYNAVGTAW